MEENRLSLDVKNDENLDLNDLYDTIVDLITDLKEIFTSDDEKTDLIIIEFFYKKIDKEKIRKHIINKVLPHEKYIEKRKIKFFDKNCKCIFGGLPEDRVTHYRNVIFEEKKLSQNHMNMIWDYLDVLIELTKPYQNQI